MRIFKVILSIALILGMLTNCATEIGGGDETSVKTVEVTEPPASTEAAVQTTAPAENRDIYNFIESGEVEVIRRDDGRVHRVLDQLRRVCVRAHPRRDPGRRQGADGGGALGGAVVVPGDALRRDPAGGQEHPPRARQ